MKTTAGNTQAFDADRPTMFNQIVGNEGIIRRITSMIANNRLPRVSFLTGPTGSGKTTLGRIIARAELCQSREVGRHEPCGKCGNCRKPLNDNACSIMEYHEYDANSVTDETLSDLSLMLLRSWEVIFIDELQDMAPTLLKRLRKMIEGTTATLILTTSHPDEIEDAVRNRLKSYEYSMTRPTLQQTVDFLERQFKRHDIRYESRSLLVRVAEALNCEMRPCAEFAKKVLAEAGTSLESKYLDEIFGCEAAALTTPPTRRRSVI